MKCLTSLWSACILALAIIINTGPVSANGSTLSKEEALRIADHEMGKLRFNLSEWKVHLDENNAGWKEVSALRRSSPFPEAKEYFDKQESRLKGHEYWAVHYEHLAAPDVAEKDGEVWVFITRDSGKVLLVIPPGH